MAIAITIFICPSVESERPAADAPPAEDETSGQGQRDPLRDTCPGRHRHGILQAATLLSVGLVLEAVSTFWTLAQASSLGALDGPKECGGLVEISSYLNEFLPRNCELVEFADVLVDERAYNDYTDCGSSLEEPPAADFWCHCLPMISSSPDGGCSWTRATYTQEQLEGLCLALPLYHASGEDEDFDLPPGWVLTDSVVQGVMPDSCGSASADYTPAFVLLTLVSLGFVLESAYEGQQWWKRHFADSSSAMQYTWFSVVKPVGIAVAWANCRACEYNEPTGYGYFSNLRWTGILAINISGMLLQFTSCRPRVAKYLPYLGTFGDGLIWLSLAMMKVLVVVYIAWRRQSWEQTPGDFFYPDDVNPWCAFQGEVVGVVVLEGLGLIAVLTGLILFIRARYMMVRSQYPHELLLVEGAMLVAIGPVAAVVGEPVLGSLPESST